MFARASHRRSRKRSAPKPPGVRWWAYVILIAVAVVAAGLVVAAMLEF
ncbi:hypothetical protein KZX37_00185 [Microbacterium sp. EYE_5]|nr:MULTISPECIES: hypothetical protein [unclassified Microbacterium]MCK6079030.1 hypothetical protein [Microbacterium sp. EYE_382]MCK6084300.1 hypothetical protein [Microbacterium sp. EYE_384]MCK6123471.1 hypothetical protein [Microbacterium sp. EYE_80]MCK6125064.1 hypothetical protein [Microbacterium sp. EYE_79]MCK6139984.1 hypothetical protein [Microbacterium sp. EYE_39]